MRLDEALTIRYMVTLIFFTSSIIPIISAQPSDVIALPQCEPIRIDICRNIGYNETILPNFVGMETQTDVEFTLQTFAPLIEYVCSTQLKLFLCTVYVPMCSSKAPQPIGPCRSLCESVRSRCNPVLQGFGYPWPPALDCDRFPIMNNQEHMCMEGPGEAQSTATDDQHHDLYLFNGLSPSTKPNSVSFTCPGTANPSLYVKLYRYGRCAPLCDANILFGPHEKHLSEFWVSTWSYAAFGLGIIATICLMVNNEAKGNIKWWSSMLVPLVWCHNMVAIGWTIRFIVGRQATACGNDPQVPHVSLLLIDGLSNPSCASIFLLRYYFGMAACAWWSILCLGWHREVRFNSPDTPLGHITLGAVSTTHENKRNRLNSLKKRETNITQRNWSRFIAWGLPALQTATVIVVRLVDADELLGACFVGNQSDKGLQILVATPLFIYWIFGSMNLISGYLVHRRSKEILQNMNPQHFQKNSKSTDSGLGTFVFIYCIPFATLLLAVIYEFANIDIWLNVPAYLKTKENTPLWPFLTRVFSELMLGQICFAWILGPRIATMCRRQLTPKPFNKTAPPTIPAQFTKKHSSSIGSGGAGAGSLGHSSGRASNIAYSTVSYQTINPVVQSGPQILNLNEMPKYAVGGSGRNQNKCSSSSIGTHKYGSSQKTHRDHHHHHNHHHHHHQNKYNQGGHHSSHNRYNKQQSKVQMPATTLYTFGNETIL